MSPFCDSYEGQEPRDEGDVALVDCRDDGDGGVCGGDDDVTAVACNEDEAVVADGDASHDVVDVGGVVLYCAAAVYAISVAYYCSAGWLCLADAVVVLT